MIFKIKVGTDTLEPWWEDYDVKTDDPEAWARIMIAQYNEGNMERYGDAAHQRILISVRIIRNNNNEYHEWIKTNLVTKGNRLGDCYDTYQCRVCGCKGKRYGLSETITRDSKYKAKRWQTCPGE